MSINEKFQYQATQSKMTRFLMENSEAPEAKAVATGASTAAQGSPKKQVPGSKQSHDPNLI